LAAPFLPSLQRGSPGLLHERGEERGEERRGEERRGEERRGEERRGGEARANGATDKTSAHAHQRQREEVGTRD
jgi:hypothetical protein